MDTVVTNGRSRETLNNPNMLAKKAKKEIRQMGFTNIRCPKCGGSPEITMTSRGERTIVSCNCGYVHDVEINF